MGSTASPQDGGTCPNCGSTGTQIVAEPAHDTALFDCHNENCAVDLFWGGKDS